MDANQILAAISSVGFPIVVCGLCMWYVKYRDDKHAEELAAVNAQHSTEMKHMTEALNNNTLALQKLCERMEK